MTTFESLKGFSATYCLYTGVKSGIFEYYFSNGNSYNTVESLASETNLNAGYVLIWTNTAVAFGFLEKGDVGYRVRQELFAELCDRNNPKYMGGLVEIFVDHISQDMHDHASAMHSNSGRSFRDHSIDFVEIVSDRGCLRAQMFIDALSNRPEISTVLNDPHSLIVDLGCGTGAFIATIAQHFDTPTYKGFDGDVKSLKIARNKYPHLASNLSLLDLEDVQVPACDLVFMVLTLHEIKFEHRIDLLKKIKNALSKNGLLIVIEFEYPNEENDYNNPRFLMGIMDQFFEMTWSTKHLGVDAQTHLLQSAGFIDINTIPIANNPYRAFICKR